MIRSILLSMLSALALVPASSLLAQNAPAPTLKIGDPAPALAGGEWVQGDPVQGFEKGKVYILEFWATWCGPCKAAIPHVNELQKKYADKGLVVIGQNCWEREDAKVKPFVTEMGDKMTYRVRMDDKSTMKAGAMAETWMKAAGRNGIPCTFVVGGEGKVLWIGHPMKLTEAMLDEMLAGKFDTAAATLALAKEQEEQAKRQAMAGVMREKIGKISALMKDKNWDEAEKGVEELASSMPDKNNPTLQSLKMDIAVGRGQNEEAIKCAQEMAAGFPEQVRPVMGLTVARRLVAAAQPAPELAKAALGMVEDSIVKLGDKNPSGYLTKGEIQLKLGQKEEAAKSFDKALEIAPADIKPQLQKRIDTLQGKSATPAVPAAEVK